MMFDCHRLLFFWYTGVAAMSRWSEGSWSQGSWSWDDNDWSWSSNWWGARGDWSESGAWGAAASSSHAGAVGLTTAPQKLTEWSKDFPEGQFVTAFLPLSLPQFMERSYSPIATFIEQELGCHIMFRPKPFKDGRKRSRVTVKGLQAQTAWMHLMEEIKKLEELGKISGGPIAWHACPPARIAQDVAAKEEAEKETMDWGSKVQCQSFIESS